MGLLINWKPISFFVLIVSLNQNSHASYEGWVQRWDAGFIGKEIIKMEGALVLHLPEQKEAEHYLAIAYLKKNPAIFRLSLWGQDENENSLLYRDKKLYSKEISKNKWDELSVKSMTYNDILFQWLRFLMGDRDSLTLISKHKFEWTSRLENIAEYWLEAKPHNKSLKMESLRLRLGLDEKFNFLRLLNSKGDQGFVFEVFKQTSMPKDFDFESPSLNHVLNEEQKVFLKTVSEK